jgi:hypothetical protein
MSVYLYAGRADSPEMAKVGSYTVPPVPPRSPSSPLFSLRSPPLLFGGSQCDACAAALQSMPAVRCRRYVRIEAEWAGFLRSLCTSWQIQGWDQGNEVMVWTGSGQLVGNAEDFLMLVHDKYDIALDLPKSALDDLTSLTVAAAAAEKAGRGKFASPSTATDDAMIKVLMIKGNASTPIERTVRESHWKADMDCLLGRKAVFSDGTEILRTETERVFAWVNNDAEFGDRVTTLATMALQACPPLAKMCFRYSLYGSVILYKISTADATPLDYTASAIDAHFLTDEMELFQKEAAATRIQSRARGRTDAKVIAEKRLARQEEREVNAAAEKIQSRYR